MRRIPQLAPTDARGIGKALPGSDILIDGEIWAGSQPQFRTLVAYVREGVTRGRWRVEDRITPPLVITTATGQVRVRNSNYRLLLETELTGWQPPSQLFRPPVRYRGLAPGSRVAVFGTIAQDQEGRAIEAVFVAGGDHSILQAAIARELGVDNISLIVGDGLLLLGGWILAITSLQMILTSRRTHSG